MADAEKVNQIPAGAVPIGSPVDPNPDGYIDIPKTKPQPVGPPTTDLGSLDRQVATGLGILQGDTYLKQAVEAPGQLVGAVSPVAPPPKLSVGNVYGADPNYVQTQGGDQATIPPTPDSHTPAGYGGDGLHSGAWQFDLLSMLGLPTTYENVRALTAWQKAEGGGSDGPSHSAFNWLNTTRNMPGATSINKVGVKSYASYHDGLVATAQALTNGLYGNVLSAFAQGNSAVAVGQAVAGSKWGTGSGLLRALGAAQ